MGHVGHPAGFCIPTFVVQAFEHLKTGHESHFFKAESRFKKWDIRWSTAFRLRSLEKTHCLRIHCKLKLELQQNNGTRETLP